MANYLKLLFTFLFSIFLVNSVRAQKSYDNREEIPKEYKWNLSEIYPNWDAWEKGLEQMQLKMDEIIRYKGKLKEGPEKFLTVLKLQNDLGIMSIRVYRYPGFSRDLDTRDQKAIGNLQKVQIAFEKYGTATSWINPEMLEIPWSTMEKWLNSNKEFEPYKFGVSDLYRQQAHVLDAEKEKLISFYSGFNSTPNGIYTSISTADIDYPVIDLSTGEKVQATNGNYFRILSTDKNQEDRKKIFEAHYNTFKKNKNTYASIYESICRRDWANAQARNFKSCLEATLDANNIPVAIYENLINTVRANTGPLKRYDELRKKILGLEKYNVYDGSIPLTDFNNIYDFEKAKNWVELSVKPMGEDYATKYANAIKSGWIDVFESKGKRSGAYSGGVYGVHPFMLLNYNGTLDNVFTLAHEMGHTMHTLLADENQPYSTSGYTLFVAEVASTFNEALLLDNLLEKCTDPKERIALIQQAIRNISGTFYFQCLLADYELQAHRLVEKGKPFTEEELTKIMHELNDVYYGNSIEKDEYIDYCWARIPHFYNVPFYVYQYATCFASSSKLFNDYKNASTEDKPKVINRLLTLLKSGGNDYPMEQLKKAGVDLTKPEVIKSVIDRMDYLVSLLEKEVTNLKQ